MNCPGDGYGAHFHGYATISNDTQGRDRDNQLDDEFYEFAAKSFPCRGGNLGARNSPRTSTKEGRRRDPSKAFSISL
ncbi:unnamed protein product [Heligmosomoides polygyrus]|uniref:Sod_Cu domain-containing protein n=1 Tax=Heligmosomoides polygyrus TaxID=6339 RepID=A0A183FIW3_HELPZ|nr:unnamed protein product [Heligmosomoides polygyrus]